MKKISVLFVCLGNICRSPVAEGVFREKVKAANLLDDVTFDSAGTAAWHTGNPPDSRMIAAALERGYDISDLRARQVKADDLTTFDYILAMDDENLADLEDMIRDQPPANLSLFLDHSIKVTEREVPDPYFGGKDGFFHVIDLVENAADGLMREIESQLNRPQQEETAIIKKA